MSMAKTNAGSSTTSDSAPTIHTASSYDYLKQFYEKVSDDPGGKNPLPPNHINSVQ